ncbi:hypothetical protein HHI36_020169 [Cryptolaemus montrouzieri]|uniref:Mitochondrial thiamine pyrophosphate carrier n=1 Tax=Cryptolaemus montrouzieri TaxID=559131 RepID=A0ABD2NAI1_9CUCU
MVGYDPKKNLSELDYIFAGSASGFITRLFCQPLDVLKIRFQLQVEPTMKKYASNSKYQSIFQATKLIVKEEGIRALWKGHIPGQLLSITYGFAQFSTFEVLTKQAAHLGATGKWNTVVNFSCGLFAGCTATLVSFPFDVVRTRLVAQSYEQKSYKGVIHAFGVITKNEGRMVLFRGVVPTFIQVGPHAGFQFMFYKIFINFYKTFISDENSTLSSSVFAGSAAGFCAKIAVYPFDLVKKRLQISGFNRGKTFGHNFSCNGMMNCIYRIYKKEGYIAFFKGLNASLVKAVATSALHFSSYEVICETIHKYRSIS